MWRSSTGAAKEETGTGRQRLSADASVAHDHLPSAHHHTASPNAALTLHFFSMLALRMRTQIRKRRPAPNPDETERTHSNVGASDRGQRRELGYTAR